MDVVLVSDTHVPSRASTIPEWVCERLRTADRVVHAGDFDSVAAFETVRDLAGGEAVLTAVRGNADPPTVDLPRVATLDVEGVRLAVTHGDRFRSGTDFVGFAHENDADVAVAGHTHSHVDEDHDGVRLLNPGSATGAAPADETSLSVLSVEAGTLAVEHERR
jgi:putative phosphoesterase